jgi:hypothetical protein
MEATLAGVSGAAVFGTGGLDKTQMENKQIERRNNNHPARRSFWQSVDAALARMCPAKEPNPRLSPAPCFTVPVAGQVVGQVCVCAVYDRPFLDRF